MGKRISHEEGHMSVANELNILAIATQTALTTHHPPFPKSVKIQMENDVQGI